MGKNMESENPTRTRVKEIKKTCEACPSQWDGRSVDGERVYIRYRWGYLAVYLGEEFEKQIFGAQLGGDWHGVLETTTMMRFTSTVLDWTGCQMDEKFVVANM